MNLKKLGFSKSTRALFFKMAFVVCVMAGASFLQVSPGCSGAAKAKTPCDPEYMDALEARAWLEAQREISQNQNLIYKPDSVLEYTCFDYFLNEAASNFGQHRQFSETDRWDGRPQHFTETTTDEALIAVVFEPLIAYLTSNFLDKGKMGGYLNNRFPGQEYTPQAQVAGGTAYQCAELQKVWELARCTNFVQETIFDGFYDFLYYENTSWDPRMEVNQWNMMCDAGDSRYAAARTTAFNEDQALFQVDNAAILPPEGNGQPYLEDDIVTHLEHILPGQCNLCIPTGIRVQRPDMNPFDEQICTNPGCPAPGGGASGGGGGGGPVP